MNMRLPGISLPGLVLAAICIASTPLRAATPYEVEDLGTLPGDFASVAMGINESGEVVGRSVPPAPAPSCTPTKPG